MQANLYDLPPAYVCTYEPSQTHNLLRITQAASYCIWLGPVLSFQRKIRAGQENCRGMKREGERV